MRACRVHPPEDRLAKFERRWVETSLPMKDRRLYRSGRIRVVDDETRMILGTGLHDGVEFLI